MAVAINPSESFAGDLKISFGTSTTSLTTHLVATISDQDDFTSYENNTRTFVFEQENLTENTTYYYKWSLETATAGTIEEEIKNITTPSGFAVLPYQNFEIPEAGLIPGDTIGYIKYEDTDGTWTKVQTYYKTTLGLKEDGSLWAWGRNSKKLVVNPASQSEVVYEPIQVMTPPSPEQIDADRDGFLNIDEELNNQSDPNEPLSQPLDSDGDRFSDALEILLGNNPYDSYVTQEEDIRINKFFIEELFDSANQILFHDFAVSRTAVLAIDKTSRHLYYWGDGNGNINLNSRVYDDHIQNSQHLIDEPDSNVLPFNYSLADLLSGNSIISDFPEVIDTSLRWDKVAISNNFANPKIPNINNLGEVYDTTAAGITEDGELYIWGVIDGLMLPNYLNVSNGMTWKDVRVGDAIIALADNGTIHEIGMNIPTSANASTNDRDNDGVADVDDAFEWDPAFQYDNDDDGFPNKIEDQVGTDKNNPDTDGDGVMDAEDQLPLDSNYSKDSDFDGLPDELDPNDDNWDSDGDGVPDGEDADPSDSSKRWDCDKDGISDEEEWQRNADPCILDTDGDGVNDKDDKYPRTWYYQYDSDGDGLPDALELINETDPNNSDSDGDGYLDAIAISKFDIFRQAANTLDCTEGWERCDQWLYFWRFWDIKYDCDGNGWVSWEEWEGISDACQNLQPRDEFPNDALYTADTDRDGDPDEIDEDDDNDGFKDVVELDSNVNTDPKDWQSQPEDKDGDRMADVIEVSLGLDPFNWDTDGDGAGDGWDAWPLDPTISWDDDKDRIENWIEENRLGTDPQNPDTDGDDVNDNEDLFPLDPNQSFDSDGDGLSDSYEISLGMKPNSKDSDGDGYYDAPCDRTKQIFYTDPDTGYSWWTDNWRECDGYWAQNPDNNNKWQYYPSSWIEDKFPTNRLEWSDNDNDGIGDNEDTDDDNDGTLDSEDDFPYDSSEQKNTDKPTIANGYLTDADGDGIYGEDYNNDGWVEETTGDRRRFDFVGDNKDLDDDGDLFLDVDEIASGTDPLDPDDFPGSDSDRDGFSDTYEINVLKTDPNDWDTDDDGVSDGWQYPNRDQNTNWSLEIDIKSTSAKPQFGDEYKMTLQGWYNPNAKEELIYTVTSSSTAMDILQYFNDAINDLGGIQYLENGSYLTESFSSVVSGTKIIISGVDYQKNMHINAFSSVVNGTKLILSDDYGDWNWKSDFFAPRDPETCCSWYFYGEGRLQGNLKGSLLIDAFPKDPTEFWDTDGDGTGDNSDVDIDGDGLTNAFELTPREPKHSGSGFYLHTKSNPYMVDSDFDGVNDNLDGIPWNDRESIDFDGDFRGDENDDDDDDNDGLSDLREIALGLNTNNADSDGDGFSDGCIGIGFESHDEDGNWQETIKVVGTVTQTIAGETYSIFIEGWNNWENRAEIKITTSSPTSAVSLLTAFADEINQNYNTIPFQDYYFNGQYRPGEEKISASVSGTSLIIKGEDSRAQIHVQTWDWRGVVNINTSFCSWQNEDRYPDDENEWYDRDWDDIGDNEDLDDDNDGLPDSEEEALGTNPYYWDTDGDRKGDDWDQMPLDINSFEDQDGDGIPDFTVEDTNQDGFYDPDLNEMGWYGPDLATFVDQDVDGDGISNQDEDNGATNRYEPDSDFDGYNDGIDKFPVWHEEWFDTDLDGLGNNRDRDDDGDGFSDLDEAFNGTDPLDASSKPNNDQDQDFLSDKYEVVLGTSTTKADSDGDTYLDGEDHFPLNSKEWLDTDNDGVGNNQDENDDDDHFSDFVEKLGDELNVSGWNLNPLIFDDETEAPNDEDWDGIPDILESAISQAYETKYNAASNLKKREMYRGTKNLWRPRYDWNGHVWTGNGIPEDGSPEEGVKQGSDMHWTGRTHVQYDLDSDNNGTQDHNENIDYDDIDGDGWPNIQDRDSDNDGLDDGWDKAIFDSRGHNDQDLDFISDNVDVDKDGDKLLNWWESYYGTDNMLVDSDGDGTDDAYDYMGFDSRVQTEEQFNNMFDLDQIGSQTNWKKISTWNYGQVGASYAAINTDNELYVWGVNYGALPVHDDNSLEAWQNGEEYGFIIPQPIRVRPDQQWENISLGFKFGIGYSTDGTFYSWGRNLSSQLGNGKPTTYETFSEPDITLGEITQISSGEQQAGIINKDGKLRMIGSNDQGQLGTGSTNSNIPQELDWDDIDGDIKEVKVTETETQIITNQNAIWAYGDNLYAQLGRGTRDTKAENYEAKKIEAEGWTEVFAITEHVYAFKSDGSLWAWGKNKNFDLGLGFKSEYVATPTKVEGVNKSDIKDFSPVNGGFVYIKNNGELWGAGANFYTGSWFPLSSPRKIGRYTDWDHFHDFMNSELNILIEKTDGSIWGAGANWNSVLTQDPCPEPKNQIEKITISHPNQYQETQFEISQITGSATITIKVNNISLTVSPVTSSSGFVNSISSLFNANNTLTNALTITVTPTNSGNSTILFKSKAYQQNTFSFSIIDKSTDFAGDINFEDLVENISGTVTYTVNLSGSRIEASASNLTDAVANIKNSIETSDKIDPSSYSLTVTNTNSILIENRWGNSFFINTELQNSNTSSSSISSEQVQAKISVDCYPGFISNLVEIFEAGNDWDQLSMGLKHVIGLTDNGDLYSWGANEQQQLGLGANQGKWSIVTEPTPLSPVVTDSVTKTFVSVDASAEVSFAIASDTTMYAWGDNDLGTLAVGDYSDKNIPTLVKGDINWKSNLGGYRFQVALDENDTPYGWGYRKFGQLGALGKVKGDDIVWDTDLSESNGIVQTLNGEEYIIATEELVNYLDTVLNFEFSGGTSKKGTVQSPSGSTSKFSPKTLDAPSSRKMNVGKWKVKKTKSGFSGKSAIEPGDDSSLKTSETPYSFDIVDVNEVPSSIELTDISSKLTSKGEQFISNIVVTDPDEDDIITVTIPSNSPNASKFEIKNQKLYYDSSTSKANVPYQVIIRATDWEGLSLEVQFEVLVDEDGQLSIEEVITESSSGGGSSYYDARFIDSDGDGFVDADEMATGTDPYDFRSFPTDIDNDGILDFYDGDIDNDGYLNEDDQFPTNPNEWIDADGDGIPDNLDNDDDNDGVVDIDVSWREGYIIQDLFPNDPNESSDFDRDGIGDNSDQDDDNDGVIDSLDAFPFNPYEWMDTDNDSIGDNADEDIDNDGYSNFDEIAIGTNPLDATDFPADQDGDFVPDAIDSDIDGDGISNAFDNAPELYNPDQEFVDDENHYALILPDFFSPNGDGVNDTWVIGEIQRYSTNQVWVYDATGNLVFNQKQYGNDWGGTNDGQVLPKASYLYMIDADGNGTIDYQGWVFITR
ncbi:gliding motility-associated C-terminal domain-containing protein [Flavobacteriaceae bacterium]|nr:gliding motility-associated C-terminal domain-containing protein [Flavobacteriaceae bacterium]